MRLVLLKLPVPPIETPKESGLVAATRAVITATQPSWHIDARVTGGGQSVARHGWKCLDITQQYVVSRSAWWPGTLERSLRLPLPR